MKKFIVASALALTVTAFAAAPALRAQDISIKDPAEYAAYQNANSQADPKAKAVAEESFLKTYPQTVVKPVILNDLVNTYWQLQDADNTVNAASRLLQLEPGNPQAIFYSVYIKKQQCEKTSDPQTCDDAAALAQKGLGLSKPASVSDADWQKIAQTANPLYDSTIALDAALSKKDFKTAQADYAAELKLYGDDQSKTAGLKDTLLLAQAYSQPGAAQDLKMAIWFYARFVAFAPAQYKAQFEPTLESYYKRYHGGLDGLDDIKKQAAASVLPPGGVVNITPGKTYAEQIHDMVVATPDLSKGLGLTDKETVLASGSKEDADKVWAVLKDQQTQVPGIVIAITANQIQLAVSPDAKASKVADFTVNLKKPLTDAELKEYPVGFEFKSAPAAELAGTYDSYAKVPATATTSEAAQIILRDGEVVPAEKKKAAPAHKPSPAHHHN